MTAKYEQFTVSNCQIRAENDHFLAFRPLRRGVIVTNVSSSLASPASTLFLLGFFLPVEPVALCRPERRTGVTVLSSSFSPTLLLVRRGGGICGSDSSSLIWPLDDRLREVLVSLSASGGDDLSLLRLAWSVFLPFSLLFSLILGCFSWSGFGESLAALSSLSLSSASRSTGAWKRTWMMGITLS